MKTKIGKMCLFLCTALLLQQVFAQDNSSFECQKVSGNVYCLYGEERNIGWVYDEMIRQFRCSVFTIARGDRIFFGGNDDYINPDSYYWVDPGGGERYGVVWIGQPDNVQQGINERGLAYDANGLPRVNVNPHTERTPVTGSYTSYPIHILHECATVEEVITWVTTHQWHSYMHDQLQFADATGDAVIISAGRDGELVFTRKQPGDGFLVSTNFNVAQPSNGFGYPCRRYATARERLGHLLDREDELTVQDAAGVLDAVHQEGGSSWTISSLLADLSHGTIYLYYFYQFDKPIILRVQEELANPRDPGPLSGLFPEEVRNEAARRYRQIQAKAGRCRTAGIIWLVCVMICIVFLLIAAKGKRLRLNYCLPAVLVLGPVALLVLLFAGFRRPPKTGRLALTEAIGDVMPVVVAFIVFFLIIIVAPALQSANAPQLVMLLFLPTLIGWLFFHGPLLSPVAEKGGGPFLGARLPHALVTANMGMGGICVVAMPLINQSSRTCALWPLNPWTVVTCWVATAAGALIALALLTLFERWAVKNGFLAWSVLAFDEGELRTPSWRRLKWWIPLSYALLIFGCAIGAALGQMAAG